MFGFKVTSISLILILILTLGKARPTSTNHSELLGIQSRIVGGIETRINSFPHQVFISINHSFCGGSIFKEKIIITAAHCLRNVSSPKFVTVYAGISYFDRRSGFEQPVEKIISHEFFNIEKTFSNDIALLILESPLKFSETLKPIALPEPDESLPVGAEVTVSGWGSVYENGPVSNVLQYTTVTVISNEDCRKVYAGHITSGSLCAGEANGGRDSCQGDSGGPLIYKKKLIGVTSFGNGCARPGVPGVYSRVSHFRPWIDLNAKPYIHTGERISEAKGAKMTTMGTRLDFSHPEVIQTKDTFWEAKTEESKGTESATMEKKTSFYNFHVKSTELNPANIREIL